MLKDCYGGCGDLLPFNHKSINEAGHWCWGIRPGSQLGIPIHPKVFDGVEVRALCGPVKSFHTNLDKPFLNGPGFVHCIADTGKGLPQTVARKVRTTESSRMSLYAVGFRFPFTGLAQTMKNSHRLLFLFHQTLQLALCIGAGSVLLASTKPSFVRLTARWKGDSSLQITGFYCSKVQWQRAHPHSSWCLALRMVILGMCVNLPTNSYCADVASRGSLELGSECCNRGQAIFTSCKLQHMAVPFCEFVWPTTLQLSRCCC